MPSGDSLADRKPIAKTPLRRAIALLSPLLIISLGLHGLAMLLPLPEKEEIVKEEPELPEPIQVLELPELDLPNSEPVPATVFVPTPEPALPPAVRPSAPAAPPPVAIQPKPQEPQISTTPAPQAPESSNLPIQQPEKTQGPVEPLTPTPVGSTSVVRTYRKKSLTSPDYLTAFSTALADGVYSDETPISYDNLKGKKLTLTLPSEDNCFEAGKIVEPESVMLPTSLGVVLSNDGEKGFLRYAVIVKSTGYDEADDLINDAMLDNDSAAYNRTDTWLRENVDNGEFPFAEKGDNLAYVIFDVEVTFEDHSCPDSNL